MKKKFSKYRAQTVLLFKAWSSIIYVYIVRETELQAIANLERERVGKNRKEKIEEKEKQK